VEETEWCKTTLLNQMEILKNQQQNRRTCLQTITNFNAPLTEALQPNNIFWRTIGSLQPV
jgi:hypothetical protein